MKFSTSIVSLFISSVASKHLVIANDISLVEFQDLLYSEMNSEIVQQQYDSRSNHHDRRLHGRILQEADVTHEANHLWKSVVKHGWDLSESLDKNNKIYSSSLSSSRRRLQANSEKDISSSNYFPFLVCSQSTAQVSAYSRLKPMLDRTAALFEDAVVVRNDAMKTCYHVSMLYEDAKLIREAMEIDNEEDHDDSHQLKLAPMTDLMKIQVDTMSMIYDDDWTVPKKTSPDDWERLVRVGLSVGHRMNLNADEVQQIADNILNDIQSLSQEMAYSKEPSRNLREKNSSTSKFTSISDAFSLTAATSSKSNGDQVTRGLRSKKSVPTLNRWSRALKEGLEEDHACEGMFNQLSLNAHYDNQGFDIVLNPSSNGIDDGKHTDGIEKKECEHKHTCTASNTHCVASLIVALSTHPMVWSIETEGPIIANDFESQWITQTKSEGSRPLRDIGINGKNQIISVIDSGLDINHKYFGPTHERVFNVS